MEGEKSKLHIYLAGSVRTAEKRVGSKFAFSVVLPVIGFVETVGIGRKVGPQLLVDLAAGMAQCRVENKVWRCEAVGQRHCVVFKRLARALEGVVGTLRINRHSAPGQVSGVGPCLPKTVDSSQLCQQTLFFICPALVSGQLGKPGAEVTRNSQVT